MQCSCVEPKLQHCLSTQLAWQIRFAAHLPCVLPSGLHLCLSSSVHAHTEIINIFVHFGVNKTISAHQSNNRQYLDTINFRHLITLKKIKNGTFLLVFGHLQLFPIKQCYKP